MWYKVSKILRSRDKGHPIRNARTILEISMSLNPEEKSSFQRHYWLYLESNKKERRLGFSEGRRAYHLFVWSHTGKHNEIFFPSLECVHTTHFNLFILFGHKRPISEHCSHNMGPLTFIWGNNTNLMRMNPILQEICHHLLHIGGLCEEKWNLELCVAEKGDSGITCQKIVYMRALPNLLWL